MAGRMEWVMRPGREGRGKRPRKMLAQRLAQTQVRLMGPCLCWCLLFVTRPQGVFAERCAPPWKMVFAVVRRAGHGQGGARRLVPRYRGGH